MLKLVLDENISPALSKPLWEQNIDNFHVRDRGELRISDHRLFKMACGEGRAIVTINAADFARLAGRVETHPGLICIPSGGTRSMQFDYVMRAVDYAKSESAVLPNLRDRILYVPEDGSDIAVVIVRLEKTDIRVIKKKGA